MKPTLKKIARDTGLSLSTVVRAFHSPDRVSAETRQRVLAAAKQMNYHSFADTVLLVAWSLQPSSYHDHLIAELHTLIRCAGLKTEIIGISDLQILEKQDNICGVISLSVENGLERYWSVKNTIPLICVNTQSSTLQDVHSVCSNEPQGMEMLCRALLHAGHRQIGYFLRAGQINGENFSSAQRLEVFRRQLSLHQCASDRLFCWNNTDDFEYAVKRVAASGVTALIVNTSSDIPRLLHELKRAGKRIPQEISVTGFLEPETSCYADPPLTGICHDYPLLAKHTFGLLINRINHRPAPCSIEVNYQFFDRNSIATLK